jgi:hypothetical protein
MSVIIVPIAGPDFYSKEFGVRPLYPMGQSTLIEYVLKQRFWFKSVARGNSQLIFVLRKEGLHTEEMRLFIDSKFPSADTIILSRLSAGAPLSALAGISLSEHHDVPVIVDLADIAFSMSWDSTSYFRENQDVDAVVPYFRSDDPKFSYLKLNGVRVIEAREKQVISSNASAGVYFFRDVSTYLRAVIYCLQHPDMCKVGSAFFVCPSINGLIENGRQVHAIEVENVEPISALFHES